MNIEPITDERVKDDGNWLTEKAVKEMYAQGMVLCVEDVDPVTGEKVERPLSLEEILENVTDDGNMISIDKESEK